MPSPRGNHLTLWVVERLFLFLALCFASTQECKCCKGRTGSSDFGALGQVKDLNCYDLRLSYPLKIDLCIEDVAVLFPLLQLDYPIKTTFLTLYFTKRRGENGCSILLLFEYHRPPVMLNGRWHWSDRHQATLTEWEMVPRSDVGEWRIPRPQEPCFLFNTRAWNLPLLKSACILKKRNFHFVHQMSTAELQWLMQWDDGKNMHVPATVVLGQCLDFDW